MRNVLFIVVLLFFVMIVPVVNSQEAQNLPIEDERFLVSYEDVLFTTGSDIQAVLDSLESVPDIEDEGWFTYYRWGGLEIRSFQNSPDVGLITVTSPEIRIASGIAVGDRVDHVVSVQGQPDMSDPGQLYYFGPPASADAVFFVELKTQDGIVTSIIIGTAQ